MKDDSTALITFEHPYAKTASYQAEGWLTSSGKLVRVILLC